MRGHVLRARNGAVRFPIRSRADCQEVQGNVCFQAAPLIGKQLGIVWACCRPARSAELRRKIICRKRFLIRLNAIILRRISYLPSLKNQQFTCALS